MSAKTTYGAKRAVATPGEIEHAGWHVPVATVSARVQMALSGLPRVREALVNDSLSERVHRSMSAELAESDFVRDDHAWLPGTSSVASMVAVINLLSSSGISQAHSAVSTLLKAGAFYRFESGALNERIRERLPFREVPGLEDVEAAVQWMLRAQGLDHRDYPSLRIFLDKRSALAYEEMRQQFVWEDASERGTRKRLTQLKVAKAAVKYWERRLSVSAVKLVPYCRIDDFQPGRWRHRPFLPRVGDDAAGSDMMGLAATFNEIGESFLDLPNLDKKNTQSARQIASLARDQLVDAGYALILLSIWMRALADQGERKYCFVCYRHRSLRRFCREHKISGGSVGHELRYARKVQPLFIDKLESMSSAFAMHGLRIDPQTFLGLDTPDSDRRGSREIEPSLEPLQSQLSLLGELAGERLRDRLQTLFRCLHANALSLPSADPARTAPEIETARKLSIDAKASLTLEGFFRIWFNGYTGPLCPDVEREFQLGVDREHPVSRGHLLDPSMLVYDLLRHRAWQEAQLETPDARHHKPSEHLKLAHLGSEDAARRMHVTGQAVRKARKKLGLIRQTK